MRKATHKLRALGDVSTALHTGTQTHAAKVLGVNQSSVSRWRARDRQSVPPQDAPAGLTPDEWAADVRSRYQLSASEQQLVSLAAEALRIAQDASVKPADRLAASGRFASLLRLLALSEG